MGSPIRIGNLRNPNETMRLVVTIFVGAVVGFFLGVSFSTISLTKMNLPSTLFPSIDLSYIEDKYSGFSTQALLSAWSSLKGNKQSTEKYVSQETKIWVPTNPRGTESLAPGIIASESDFYLRRLWGLPSEVELVGLTCQAKVSCNLYRRLCSENMKGNNPFGTINNIFQVKLILYTKGA